MSDQPPPSPFGNQPQGGGYQQPNPTQPFPQQPGNSGPPQGNYPQGPPQGGYGGTPPPGGYGGTPPPGGYGGPPPPGGYGGPPQGYGGPPPGPGGFQGPSGPPPKNKAPLIIGIIAGVLILGGAVGGFFLLSGDDGDSVAVSTLSPTAEETNSDAPVTATTPEATETPSTPPTGGPDPQGTMPAAPPDVPTADATPSAAPAPAPPAPDPAPAPPPSSGGSMSMNEGANGEITTAGATGDFFFDGTAGEEVVVTMIATGGDLDPILTLFGPDGTEIDRNDDAVNPNLPSSFDSQIQASLPADGEYRVEASGFLQTTGPFEINLEFPAVLTATDVLSESVQEVAYDYPGTAGQAITINVRSIDDQVDPVVTLLDPDGNEIGRNDDGGQGLDSLLEATLPTTGNYTVVVSAFSTRYGEFSITLAEV